MSSIYELYTSGGSGIGAESDLSKYQYYIFHIGFTNEVAIGDRGRNEISFRGTAELWIWVRG